VLGSVFFDGTLSTPPSALPLSLTFFIFVLLLIFKDDELHRLHNQPLYDIKRSDEHKQSKGGEEYPVREVEALPDPERPRVAMVREPEILTVSKVPQRLPDPRYVSFNGLLEVQEDLEILGANRVGLSGFEGEDGR